MMPSGDGSTLLSPDEESDLIPGLTTREELNEWERLNILEAYSWALEPRGLRRRDPLEENYIRELHLRMFDQTWRWAGRYRKTEKNIGVPCHQLREQLAALLGDVRYWIDHETFARDEIAVRFHHRLVFIHPFANGNGRHARLMADVVVTRRGGSVFTWGRTQALRSGNFRRDYIHALQSADRGDLRSLLEFARS